METTSRTRLQKLFEFLAYINVPTNIIRGVLKKQHISNIRVTTNDRKRTVKPHEAQTIKTRNQ